MNDFFSPSLHDSNCCTEFLRYVFVSPEFPFLVPVASYVFFFFFKRRNQSFIIKKELGAKWRWSSTCSINRPVVSASLHIQRTKVKRVTTVGEKAMRGKIKEKTEDEGQSSSLRTEDPEKASLEYIRHTYA